MYLPHQTLEGVQMFSVIPHVHIKWSLGVVLQSVDEAEEECMWFYRAGMKDAGLTHLKSPECVIMNRNLSTVWCHILF